MLSERLGTLFNDYDPVIRQVIQQVVALEQRYISMKNPHGIMNEIDEIITQIARKEVEQMTSGNNKSP